MNSIERVLELLGQWNYNPLWGNIQFYRFPRHCVHYKVDYF